MKPLFMKRPFMTAMAVAAAAFTATLLGSTHPAPAQEAYPSKPIRLIVPEVVGSAADLMGRIIGQRIGEALGQPVTFENLFLEAGVEKGIKAAPDGYTLIYGSSGNLALLPHVKKVSFNPLKDLTPVARFAIQPTLIATNAALPVKNLAELVAMMQANPGKLRMSTAGAGTAGHFAGEMFIAMTKVKPEVVHYNGGGPAIDAVVNGDAQWTVAPIAGRLPHVRSGKLKAMAVGGLTRLALLPDVPTVAESGYPGYDAVGWGGVFVPNGTPQPIIDKLNATIVKALTLPEVKKQLEEQGTEAAGSSQAEMAKLLADEYARLGQVAKSLGLNVD
ncbi:MAG TPA: tripartite tricarboxylate transporter substrate binding protein [Xanthobacteraceae bacterium]|jgi:tripartite-type tricarboxylate transporter receptor subunit TctC